MLKPAPTLKQAKFICSSPDLASCPEDIGKEVAFAGRSNAGKSSALNTLTQQHKLARVSKTPGRTQQINFFELNDTMRLVDLPGYGYAKVPIKMKLNWQENMQEYFEHRQSLGGIILLMDIRHPFKAFDQQMIGWANHYQMPMHVLLTKSDKLKRGAAKNTLLKVRKELKDSSQASSQLFSSHNNEGVKEAQKIILDWLSVEAVTEEQKQD